MIRARLLLTCSVVLALAATAEASIIPFGSSLTFGGTNAPDTYSATTTFSSMPVLVDNGAVEIWQQQVPTAGGRRVGCILHANCQRRASGEQHRWRLGHRDELLPEPAG